jgi:hypothetical protein
LIPLQLPLSPMRVFARGVELPHDMPVQCPHDADACHHGRTAMFDNKEQRFDRGLPLRELLFGLREFLDISGGVLEGDELPAAWQRDWIVERTFPTSVANGAGPSCRTRL